MEQLERCTYCVEMMEHIHILQRELEKERADSKNTIATLLEIKNYYWLLDEFLRQGFLSCNKECEIGFQNTLKNLLECLKKNEIDVNIKMRRCDICRVLPHEIFSLLDRLCIITQHQELNMMYLELQYHVFLSWIYDELIGRCTECDEFVEYVACLNATCKYLESKDLHQLQKFVYSWKIARNTDEILGLRSGLNTDVLINTCEIMSNSEKIVYLDFNIYDKYEKCSDIRTFLEELLNEGVVFVCSGTHLEEVLRMENEECILTRLQTIQKLTKGKIILVNREGKLAIHLEDINERLSLVKQFEAINILAELRECIVAEAREHLGLHEKNERRDKAIGSSSLLEIIENKKENKCQKQNPYLPNEDDLNRILGYLGNGDRCICDYQGMYKGDEQEFYQLRSAIVSIAELLNVLGLHGDKITKKDNPNAVYPIYEKNSYRTIRSGYYDNDHLSFATKCTYFVTTDQKLSKKANEIYSLLGIKTIPMQLVDFIEYFNK